MGVSRNLSHRISKNPSFLPLFPLLFASVPYPWKDLPFSPPFTILMIFLLFQSPKSSVPSSVHGAAVASPPVTAATTSVLLAARGHGRATAWWDPDLESQCSHHALASPNHTGIFCGTHLLIHISGRRYSTLLGDKVSVIILPILWTNYMTCVCLQFLISYVVWMA
jgi:hypothetical protein